MKGPSISIVGTGYVGLCTALGFASKGYTVLTYDPDLEKTELIKGGIPPFHEPHIEEPLQRAVKAGYLQCVTDQEEAIQTTDITFVAVGTPGKPDGGINLDFIKVAAQEIGKALQKKEAPYHLIVIKSTVTPTTTETLVKPTLEQYSDKRCGIDFGLCMNPEFLREGSAFHDVLHPDRIIIGEYDTNSGDILEKLYQSFYGKEKPPIIRTNLSTAELIKYANNSFLATKISYINQIANVCEKIPGADVNVVAKSLGLDNRISPLFLNAGLGYGGGCLPKDVKALISFSQGLDCNPNFFRAVEDVNTTQPLRAIELSKELLKDLRGKRVCVLGLAFKPNTNDMREAVSIKIIETLLMEGAHVVAYDPAAVSTAKTIFEDKIQYAASALDGLKDADCCIVTTEWEEFRQLTPEDFTGNMKNPALIDGRRVYSPTEFRKHLGSQFKAIGLGEIHRPHP